MPKQLASKDTSIEKDYKNLLHELKSILDKGLYKAYKAVDNIKAQTYWQIGERIAREELKHKKRAGYGKSLIKNLAVDLDFKRQRLYEIVKFYRTYPIVRALHGQLSWYHYLELIKLESDKQREFYESKTAQNVWSYRELRKQIKSKFYENTPPEEIQKTLQKKLPEIKKPEIFKDTYNFDFLQLTSEDKEIDIENLIINNIESFLKELGQDFMFAGRQVPMKIDNETHFIDLVLYHCAIPCKIIVDLKSGKITSRDVGQMNKYVGYYQENKQYEHEKQTIGLIIGKIAGKEEVRYALNKLEKQIFIATYKSKLPSDEKIRNAVKKIV
jgi:predicted nuclease of restriction endonuclease-like (RecB) superfamily